jgi:hypothetical protein
MQEKFKAILPDRQNTRPEIVASRQGCPKQMHVRDYKCAQKFRPETEKKEKTSQEASAYMVRQY